MIDAIAGSTYVVHIASPFTMKGDEDELVKPAVKGTNAVMKACAQHKVKRCVVTSSLLAISEPKEEKAPKDGVFTEKVWSDPESQDAYNKSKTLAEKAAWNY